MFWSDPNLYGYAYKDISPIDPRFMGANIPWQNIGRLGITPGYGFTPTPFNVPTMPMNPFLAQNVIHPFLQAQTVNPYLHTQTPIPWAQSVNPFLAQTVNPFLTPYTTPTYGWNRPFC